LQKRFGDVTAIEALDLQVGSGEFLSLLGPSGCGKTTVLRIIAGFERADRGDVLVDGLRINNMPANRRNMGMVFQAYSLFPNMTARRNVEFGLRIHGVPSTVRSTKVDEVLGLVGLLDRADRYPHQLSGGEQQRVALARALALEPSVLLLDEPLSALDAKVRVQLREEIRRIQSRLGITTIYVTHDQEEALSISDRVAVMSVGRLQQVGAPADIYRNPQTSFVAEFVGTMNRVDGKVVSGRTVVMGPKELPLEVTAHEHGPGERVAILIRPESVRLERVDSVKLRPDELGGQVQSHTFLGALTRVSVASDVGVLLADVPGEQALALAIGTPVRIRVDAGGVRLLSP
jgi:putative spermidine/putrescine transport system ATP-binding protein